MQISEAAPAAAAPVAAAAGETCRFPKLEECAHFHYERVQLPQHLEVTLQTSMDQSLHSHHGNEEDDGTEWHMVQVTSGDECWLIRRTFDNFKMLDAQLHQCIYDRKISKLPDLATASEDDQLLITYLERFSAIADNSLNCGPVLNWLQMDNKGHRLLVPSEESRSINTPAVAAAYSVRRYVSQARDELNLEVGDMISVIDMASPGESIWWRGKRGFQVGFFPQHCVHIIGDKVPRNMPLPPPVVGSLALTPIKPVLRKHGKLITFFRSFILNRPSRRRLKQSGILKERVFGCDLGEHLLNSGHDIPMVLKCCAEFIEKHGIVDGIYRLSGVTSNIQKLRNAFDEDRIPNLYTEDILLDIHSVASLLKMYFRELPNPLCTYQLYRSFVEAVQGCNSSPNPSENDRHRERLLKMREAVQKLPPPHYRTLEYLTRHLARVAAHGADTGMTTRNIAIVWAPNLLRCAELEVGGVAALQGVGVQAVVTEFLICYADLIFCDHLPPTLEKPAKNLEVLASPKRCRPKSLAISTPTKLITLEEARNKHMLNKGDDCKYIEVGGGPNSLPKKYHTVIDLPPGMRKRGLSKRSPLGWRSFFSKSRNNSQCSLKNRKASTPGIIIAEKSVTESDLTDMKRKLRTVKSAESLTSGHSEPASNEVDVLGPLHCLNKPPGHNRSVSHDSYFDTLQNSQNNSEGSLLDLSEIQLNFELEESEMRIFSEDESLVSSPRITKDAQRRNLNRCRPAEESSPKKQARVVLSPESMSRKRTRLEDQLSDIQYIDCNTPENAYATISTTAVIHTLPEPQKTSDSYQPKNKSPRNSSSENENKRQSLNLEPVKTGSTLPKSMTDTKLLVLNTPQSPIYQPLADSSTTTTNTTTPDFSPTRKNVYENVIVAPKSPTYENILTTISITYKSPARSAPPSVSNGGGGDSIYEDVAVNPEKAVVPTADATLPVQEASQPTESNLRPKSMSALEDARETSLTCDKSAISLMSLSPHEETDLTLSEVVHVSSTENLTKTSLETPSSTLSPNVSDLEINAQNDKRKSCESEPIDDDASVYQQVKYFRRSVHEINELLELDKERQVEENNCDSLENGDDGGDHDDVVETEAPDSLETMQAEEQKPANDAVETAPPCGVKELKNVFEKIYDRDSLPPCLRARNLKHQIKTRSLDEDEFKKECTLETSQQQQRRKSMDETITNKLNAPPKVLNQPKEVPVDDGKLATLHLTHATVIPPNLSEQLRRDRIEKYKEARRKFLQDKYRSESFKEDKDVLLSRLKVFKKNCDESPDEVQSRLEDLSIKVRRSRRNRDEDVATSDSLEDDETSKSFRTKAAMFEKKNDEQDMEDFIRDKRRNDEVLRSERRRHTYDSRERETELDRVRRISLENKSPRKERVPPTYCSIKDMKAIFESKSNQ